MRIKFIVGAIATFGFVLALASPAAADHYATGGDGFCHIGPYSGPIPGHHSFTRDAKLRVAKDGTITLRCNFKGLPSYLTNEETDYNGEYFGPSQTITGTDSCTVWIDGEEAWLDDDPLFYTPAVWRLTPSGNLTLTCVITADMYDGVSDSQ